MNKIPYKDFGKFDTQYKNWKSLAGKRNTIRKNATGNGLKEGQETIVPPKFECNYNFSIFSSIFINPNYFFQFEF